MNAVGAELTAHSLDANEILLEVQYGQIVTEQQVGRPDTANMLASSRCV